MNDSRWSVLVSLLILIVMRLLDSMLPKGYMFKVFRRWLVKSDDDDDERRRDDDDNDEAARPR